MPSGLYGSPQLGPYREVRRRQSAAGRLLGILTLEPIWARLIPSSRLRALFRVSAALVWITLVVLAMPIAVRWSSSADLATRVASYLRPDVTPELTQQQREYIAAIATQQSREAVPPATTFPRTRPLAADLALVSSNCTSQGLPPITTCHGAIRNVSGRSLSGLQVMLEWSAIQGGEPQLTASASIDLDPLLPDQTSSWTVVNRYNDALRWYRPKVMDISGRELRILDEREGTP